MQAYALGNVPGDTFDGNDLPGIVVEQDVPPAWYKALAYRSRTVADPRGVLAEFGVELPNSVELVVHDSTADMRYIVLPMRPKGTRDWSEAQLATLVTRDSMIGTAVPAAPVKPTATRKKNAA